MDPLIQYQHQAGDWLEYACGYDKGRSETDSVYQVVTEGRDKPTPGYSSCGDLAHWLYARLGVRLPWVNRAELNQFRVGMNVSRLCWPPSPARTPKTLDHEKLEAGDVFVIWGRQDSSDSHVMCVIDHVPEQSLLLTAEYGQPGGALRSHTYKLARGLTWFGSRAIHRIIPLADVLGQADRNGHLVQAEEPPQLPQSIK